MWRHAHWKQRPAGARRKCFKIQVQDDRLSGNAKQFQAHGLSESQGQQWDCWVRRRAHRHVFELVQSLAVPQPMMFGIGAKECRPVRRAQLSCGCLRSAALA